MLTVLWLLTTGSLRAFQTTFVHHTSHGNLSGKPRMDRLMGFRPGQTRLYYWSRLFWLTISPMSHARYFLARTRANLLTSSAARRLAAITYGFMLLMLAKLMGWTVFIPAVVIPGIWLYQVSGLFQVMTKHTWVRDTSGRLGAREVFVRLTYGRFMGVRTPESNLPWFRGIPEWSIWTIRMLGIYLPFRCFASASAAHVKTKKFRASLRSLLLDGLVPSASYEKQLTCSAAGSCLDWLNSGGGSPGS